MLFKERLSPVYTGEELQQVVLESGDRDRFDRWHVANAQVRLGSRQTKLSAVGSIEKQRTASPSAATGSRTRYWSGTISSARTNWGDG